MARAWGIGPWGTGAWSTYKPKDVAAAGAIRFAGAAFAGNRNDAAAAGAIAFGGAAAGARIFQAGARGAGVRFAGGADGQYGGGLAAAGAIRFAGRAIGQLRGSGRGRKWGVRAWGIACWSTWCYVEKQAAATGDGISFGGHAMPTLLWDQGAVPPCEHSDWTLADCNPGTWDPATDCRPWS